MARLKPNLHSDVLHEGANSENREMMIRLMLTTARTRRRKAVFLKGISVAGVLCLAVWRFVSERPDPGTTSNVNVHVHQRQSPAFKLVTNTDLPVVGVLVRDPRSVNILTTENSTPELRVLSEQELLTLLKGWSVALVKHPHGASELMLFEHEAQ